MFSMLLLLMHEASKIAICSINCRLSYNLSKLYVMCSAAIWSPVLHLDQFDCCPVFLVHKSLYSRSKISDSTLSRYACILDML